MSHNLSRPAFTLALLILVLFLCLLTWPVRSTTFLIPAFVLVPTGLLLVVQLVRDLRCPDPPQGDPPLVLARAATWLAVMPVLLAVAGLAAGSGVYTMAYYRLRGGESWLVSAAAGVLVGGSLALLAYALQAHR